MMESREVSLAFDTARKTKFGSSYLPRQAALVKPPHFRLETQKAAPRLMREQEVDRPRQQTT